MRRFITVDEARSEGLHPRPLELPDVASEARRTLAEAAAEARRTAEEARRQAEAVLREASRRGHEEGLVCGRREGEAEARRAVRQEAGDRLSADLAELTALARKVVDELAAQRERLLQEARGEMLEFAIELARKIVGRVAESDPRAAQGNLRKALELAGAGGGVTALVNPSQLEDLRLHAAELVEVLRLRGRVDLRGDETVGRGGVRLLGRQGEIDATIRTQLDHVVEALCGEAGGTARRGEPWNGPAGERHGRLAPVAPVAPAAAAPRDEEDRRV